jgi:hypothetical protein
MADLACRAPVPPEIRQPRSCANAQVEVASGKARTAGNPAVVGRNRSAHGLVRDGAIRNVQAGREWQ